MLLPMGMQAQSASHPPPPPLPPPPSCSTQPRSRGARRPVASAVQRGAPDKRGLGFSRSPKGPQSGGGGSSSNSDRARLNQTLEHLHIPAAPAHREGYRTRMLLHWYAINKKTKSLSGAEKLEMFLYRWPGNAQTHTSISSHSLSLAHTPRQT